MQNTLTVVIGASGKTGRRVVARLTGAGHAVRAVSRRSEPAFEWGDQSTWPAALRGASHAYITYAPDLAAAGAPEAITAFVACAQQAGVQRLVLLSGRGESGAQRCEQIIAGSGLQYAIVRASWFAQNFNEGYLLDSVRNGMIAMPAGEVAEPFVDVEDIADVAFAALTEDGHDGQIYEVTGPRLLTFAQAAAEISAAAGRTVDYLPITSAQFHAALVPTVGPDYADMLTKLCEEVFDGRNASPGDGVAKALARQPRDFADYCRTAAEAWK
ncbi:MAG TPA: NAD(P)H-binding protein [Candidatus Limnocylindrales bacterium]